MKCVWYVSIQTIVHFVFDHWTCLSGILCQNIKSFFYINELFYILKTTKLLIIYNMYFIYDRIDAKSKTDLIDSCAIDVVILCWLKIIKEFSYQII